MWDQGCLLARPSPADERRSLNLGTTRVLGFPLYRASSQRAGQRDQRVHLYLTLKDSILSADI
jgi:hypothetical protein